jgi:2,4-dienoyl-CoA reductase-like NADH-dependent reductase (Old Yellow Enzyme family)
MKSGFALPRFTRRTGYLLHEFLSPLSNKRTDRYGDSFDNRIRLVCEIVSAVRTVWPEDAPLFMRISASDWVEDGWNAEQSVELARAVKILGINLIDCSSGGNMPHASSPIGPGYQTPFAEKIRRETGILTGTVGMIRVAYIIPNGFQRPSCLNEQLHAGVAKRMRPQS